MVVVTEGQVAVMRQLRDEQQGYLQQLRDTEQIKQESWQRECLNDRKQIAEGSKNERKRTSKTASDRSGSRMRTRPCGLKESRRTVHAYSVK